ncbi:NineTeen Complex (NTC) component [Coemansia javaensis]|uniref:NineTeen Complex (NTC) component n=1 Tax=Coemansia javaensis TaxID=2761396 RepID=A0A9W8HIJ5_9FUNG|nr:NineTeen Complex (NTC) component [Coemansia javaensis]
MLYRFRAAQSAELGIIKPKERRPHLASQVSTLEEAERWRRDVIREISSSVSKIHDLSLGEAQIRDLNDQINRLLRTKNHWDARVLALGGPDYRKIGPKMLDHQGREVPGNRGYKYFGRAKELPDVREMLDEQARAAARPRRNRADLARRADAAYYGYGDEDDDGELLEFERAATAKRIARLRAAHDATLSSSDSSSSSSSDSNDN